MNHKLTFLAEFQDSDLEREFFEEEARKSLRYIRYWILIFCSINFLLVIYDYLFLDAGGFYNIVLYSFLPRVAILSIAVLLFIAAKKPKNCRLILNGISFFVLAVYCAHIFMAHHFNNLPLTPEALDVILVVLCIFLVPNRWILSLAVSALTISLFLLFSPSIVSNMSADITVVLAIYYLWIITAISIVNYKMSQYKRMQYAKDLERNALLRTDPLTKVYNRMAIDDALSQLCREQSGFSVLLFDIDNFKAVNDTYGHLTGDMVLIKIADAIRKNIRETDMLARWGGEEFLILLIGASLTTAAQLAERLRTEIQAARFEQIDMPVTASFGVTAYQPGDDLNSIITRADKLLYEAKSAGKDTVRY